MSSVQLLDCTLRDGAYLVDKTFGDLPIRGIIKGLLEASIDIVEIGFLQDNGFGEGKTVYKNSEEASKFVPKEKKDTIFTVLADYSRYSIENLDERREDSIDAVRECFFKEERFLALKDCKIIKEKGYLLFVQPVDILGYSDTELLEFIDEVNKIEPYCLSIVDTFGSMYSEDLHHVFDIINHNLISTCKIGFHSHNNMQLSNALSQEFIRIALGKRDVIIDSTISGMGRGAGNTPTELLVQYLITHGNTRYNLDAILDIIDEYMNNIRTRCDWGYNTSYFIAGCYGAHVNNITYLLNKNSIKSKDIRFILNKIGVQTRKRYDYELLEREYCEYLNSDIDDSDSICYLKKEISDRTVLILVPGNSLRDKKDNVIDYIQKENPVVIAVNFVDDSIKADFVYFNNAKRYNYWKNSLDLEKVNKILTSNIREEDKKNSYIISFNKLVKCGWEHLDNSTIMLLRLLDIISVKKIAIAGFDGYNFEETSAKNYYTSAMEISSIKDDAIQLNSEIADMLIDYYNCRKNKDCSIEFITSSRFEIYLKSR